MKTPYLLFTMLSCSIVFSQDYLDKQPENHEPGKCYVKCVTPDVFKEETIVVESIPNYDKLEIIPAVYKTVLAEVILKPSTKKFINVPAVYKKVVDTVWTKEPYHKITIDDAEFEFIDKK